MTAGGGYAMLPRMEPVPLKSVSASKLRLYEGCARRYYYAYGEGIVEPPTPATALGNYLHAVLEHYVKRLLVTGRDHDGEALYALAQSRRARFPLIPATGSVSFAEADVMLNRFAAAPIDPKKIYALEKGFRLPLTGELPVTIDGRIDRIDREADRLRIIDYKSGKHKLTEAELASDLQLKFYVVAVYELYRRRYREFSFTLAYLRDGSAVTVPAPYREEYRAELAARIKALRADTEYRKNPGEHCRHCPAFIPCRPFA